VSKENNLLFGFAHTMTGEQWTLYDYIIAPVEHTQIIFVEAEAGTGKTQIATIGAKMRGVNARYIFAPVAEGAQGFLPGDRVEKDEPYLAPIKEALRKIREEDAIIDPRLSWISSHNRTAWMHAHSHTYERGRTYENETIIIDEAQNFTLHELRKVLTRCADSCKVIVIGNTKQCDLADKHQSGFEPFMFHACFAEWTAKVKLTKNFRGRVAQWADAI
jgi:predicted ribonuclease YlaK